ncbi:MAG: hypothetical protein ACLTLQ_10970 [[Clostridium] scindens]
MRAYINVNGSVTYGQAMSQSSYVTAQKMIGSAEVATSKKSWLAENVIDACDDAKKRDTRDTDDHSRKYEK